MFSPADYALAARVTGLPIPTTPAECAAAAPLVAQVLRNLERGAPPIPGSYDGNAVSSNTFQLNEYPDVADPMERDKLQARIRAGVVDPQDEETVSELLQLIMGDPYLAQQFLNFLGNMREDSFESGDFLSQQRPLEYDLPNFGGQYSVLNAPTNTQVPASVAYTALD